MTEAVAGLVGGVGLFLLGMHLMTEGLKLAAGRALRDILARSTGTRWRGLASGVLVTALVQSSSAVTVATIGFVNAGLLSLSGAVAVIYGSNVGTTVTAWLVAAVGLQLKLKAFALPMVGIGMGLRLAAPGRRIAPMGQALAGFGLFFLGIETLKDAFDGFAGDYQLAALVGGGAGPLRVLAYVAGGFALTLVFQSSSAALALILTAAAGGAVPLGTGAALVIGANVGTTSTAALSVIGATSNAKRVAAGHIAFNAITGAVALALLPLLLLAIVRGREALHLEAEPAAVLAAFHTLFNLLGVALLLPATGPLVRFLERRFRTREEDEARPRYLDRNVVGTPLLAVHALGMELARVGAITRRMVHGALEAGAPPERLVADRAVAERLIEAVGEFAGDVSRTALPEFLESALPTALRVSRHYSEVAELAQGVAARREALEAPELESASAGIAAFRERVLALVDRAAVEGADYDAEAGAALLERVEGDYQGLKAALLHAGASGRIPVRALVDALDVLSDLHRLAKQIERAARFLDRLGEASRGEREAAPEAGPAAVA